MRTFFLFAGCHVLLAAAALAAAPVIGTQPQNQAIAYGQTASLNVAASGSGLTYQWYQGKSGNTSFPIGAATSSSFTTPSLINNTPYWVRVSNIEGTADSATALVTVEFTDTPLAAGSTPIRAIHMQQLRNRIDALRSRYALPPFSYTRTYVAGSSLIDAIAVIELQQSVTDVYDAIPKTQPAFTTNPTPDSSPVTADIEDLRSAVSAIEYNASSFNVTNAASISNTTVTVTFDAAPNAVEASNSLNYFIPSLAVVGASVNGGTVTLTTASQSPTSYSLIVSNVTRAADGEPLTNNSGFFFGTGLTIATVKSVETESPDDNTGETIVTIRGSGFATVVCPGGVRLDDGTIAMACTVEGDAVIVAKFAGTVRPNEQTVIVTNAAGSNRP